MTRATKAEVQSLARRQGYELEAARRSFGGWIAALWGKYDGRSVCVRDANGDSPGEVYGDLAVWLRARHLRSAP